MTINTVNGIVYDWVYRITTVAVAVSFCSLCSLEIFDDGGCDDGDDDGEGNSLFNDRDHDIPIFRYFQYFFGITH